jgi:hypothetical protein
VYMMRPAAGWEPGSACPTTPVAASSAPPLEITLEEDDGFRTDGTYKPIFILPTDTYAMVAFEVVDASGVGLLPAGVYSLGPDGASPWTAPAEDLTIAPELEFGSGGDIGAGSGSGASAATSRRRRMRRRLLFAEEEATLVVAPGQRRLLKGGGSGGSGGRAGAGGRTSTVGASAWGGASTSRSTYTGVAASSTYTRGSVVYGGRSHYVVAGRPYYVGHAPYSYYYGRNVFLTGSMIYFVGMGGYGCYSCRVRSDGCYSRRDCGGVTSGTTSSGFDRYQLDTALRVPPSTSPQWPLTLRIFNASIFTERGVVRSVGGTRGTHLYINFFTGDGDSLSSAGSTMNRFGWLMCVVSVLFLVMNRERLLSPDDHRGRRSRTQHSPHSIGRASNPRMQQTSPYAQQLRLSATSSVASADPFAGIAMSSSLSTPAAYGIPVSPPPTAYAGTAPAVSRAHVMAAPVARPVAIAQGQPVATAVPAGPGGGYSCQYASYPSHPPSPPASSEGAAGSARTSSRGGSSNSSLGSWGDWWSQRKQE